MSTKNLILETERLFIKPLSYEQLLQYIRLDNSLEKDLGLNPYPRTMPLELQEAFEQLILPQVIAAGNDPAFCTLWTIIEKEKRLLVGDLCFKGAPNPNGEIEIGYGSYKDFQNNGFMTEALGKISQWALDQPGVLAVIAETDKHNIASHKTLQKNHFTMTRQVDNMIWWRLEKDEKR